MPLLASESLDCDVLMHLILAARDVETCFREPPGCRSQVISVDPRRKQHVASQNPAIGFCFAKLER